MLLGRCSQEEGKLRESPDACSSFQEGREKVVSFVALVRPHYGRRGSVWRRRVTRQVQNSIARFPIQARSDSFSLIDNFAK